MTSIDTRVAKRHWKKEDGGEKAYLHSIGFVSIENGCVSLLTDEEGNDVIILTPDAAEWLASQLTACVETLRKKW